MLGLSKGGTRSTNVLCWRLGLTLEGASEPSRAGFALGGLSVCPSHTGFSAPALTLSQPNVSEGNQVTVSCEASGGALVVNLTGAPLGTPSPKVEFPSPKVEFPLTARAKDDKEQLSCSATLKVAGQVLFKTRTLELQVLCEWDCPVVTAVP